MYIKDYRLKQNLTQTELANKCNITLNYIQKLEAKTSLPRIDIALKICIILDVDPFILFKDFISI